MVLRMQRACNNLLACAKLIHVDGYRTAHTIGEVHVCAACALLSTGVFCAGYNERFVHYAGAYTLMNGIASERRTADAKKGGDSLQLASGASIGS